MQVLASNDPLWLSLEVAIAILVVITLLIVIVFLVLEWAPRVSLEVSP